jgi:hypothetical protein
MPQNPRPTLRQPSTKKKRKRFSLHCGIARCETQRGAFATGEKKMPPSRPEGGTDADGLNPVL